MKKALIILFSLLYVAVGFVSTYHAISFFAISNEKWLAIILAIAFEIGQAAVLFSLLTSKTRKIMPWILMGVLTLVQVLGNVYSSYSYMIINNLDSVKYFTDSVLFYIQDPDPQVNQVMISYITGAILPIVSLCMTSMVVDAAGLEHGGETVEVKNVPIDLTEVIDDIHKNTTADANDTNADKNEEKSKIVF
jgi:hypothetical protein